VLLPKRDSKRPRQRRNRRYEFKAAEADKRQKKARKAIATAITAEELRREQQGGYTLLLAPINCNGYGYLIRPKRTINFSKRGLV
jgi:hypothetical protein